MTVVHESACPDAGPQCRAGQQPPYLHDQRISIAELRTVTRYAATRVWAVELQLAARLVQTDIQYRSLDGAPFTPPFPNLHHRNETLFGLLDPWLTTTAHLAAGAHAVMFRLGLSLPVGKTESNPFARGELGIAHQHIQFGTGTVNPVLGVSWRFGASDWTLQSYALVQLMLYENGAGFRAGHRTSGGVSFEYAFTPRFAVEAGADVVDERAERWNGVVQQDGNLGRTDLLVGGGLRLSMGGWRWNLSLRAPVYQHVVGGQLSYPVLATLSATGPLWQGASPAVGGK